MEPRTTVRPPARPPEKAPEKIGRYQVERMLGQGGMGRVWLARDTVLGRRVAIKVLRDDLALPPAIRDELVARMGHEARAAAAVSHPNIVTLHDMGEDPAVGLFLVFEFVAAASTKAQSETPISLRDRLRKGPLDLADVAKLARELGSALTFAHQAGVIHRDVKPENILFSRTGFKIADFGIARIPDSTITRVNTVLGTPAYTAPEALSTGEFSQASDQFSFAASLYEAATGGRAFAGDDAIVTAGKVSSEPPPPLTGVLGSDPTITALDAALQRGMAKVPADRFGSCAELGEEIARALGMALPLAEASGRRLGLLVSLPTPIPGRIELERTPLSSRVASTRALDSIMTTTGFGDQSRPSIVLRRQTHRFQNIAVGVALLTIVILVLVGRRTPAGPPEPTASSSGSSKDAPPPPPLGAPVSLSTTVKPRPKPRASATPALDAGADGSSSPAVDEAAP